MDISHGKHSMGHTNLIQEAKNILVRTKREKEFRNRKTHINWNSDLLSLIVESIIPVARNGEISPAKKKSFSPEIIETLDILKTFLHVVNENNGTENINLENKEKHSERFQGDSL